jgi:tripartite ATP-independent transporter DctM subunit
MIDLSWPLATLLLLGGGMLLMMSGLIVAVAFMLINFVGAYLFLGGSAGVLQLIRGNVTGVSTFALVPIPLFVFMGEMLFHSGLALKAIDAIDRLIRRIPNRMPVVVILAGTVFSAISGSTVATTAMLGSLMLPEMLKRGYNSRLAMGSIMGIGAVDVLIPPSGLAVLLGSLAMIPITDLLIGGILPGLVLALGFVVYIVVCGIICPDPGVDNSIRHNENFRSRWAPFVIEVVPLILIFALVVASMIAGWATPTEAAALGAVATTIVAALFGALTWRALVDSLRSTVFLTSALLIIVMGATTFSQILAFSGATSGFVNFVVNAISNPYLVLVGMIAILLLLGAFIDEASIMLMTLPFFMPLVQRYGFDLTWYGVIYLMCMQIGLLSPPFGLLIFAMRGVSPRSVSMGDIMMATVPYMIMSGLMIGAIILYPPLATWLPSLIQR